MFHRVSDLVERLLQRLTWVVYYQIPIALAYLTPGFRSSDIKAEIPGALSFATGKFAIYVLWQPGGTIPWYVTQHAAGPEGSRVNTIVVANHPLTPEQVATLSGLASKILVRGNKGLDFGAYKDAILQLTRQDKTVSRLLIINDSVYVVQRGLDELLEEMMSDRYPVVSAYENWELHYHFQSFCVSFAGDILYDKAMMKFWNDYLPISIRRWCINQGEVKLSNTLRKISPKFHIVYGINQLLDTLTRQEGLGHHPAISGVHSAPCAFRFSRG